MADYVYPVDVGDLVKRARRRGPAFEKATGLADLPRDDEKLTAIVWNVSLGWFPVTATRRWHGALDIGLPVAGTESYAGAEVRAVAAGKVLRVDRHARGSDGFANARIILRHEAPGGEPFFVQYRHIDPAVHPRAKVEPGDVVGEVGFHGDFPHVEVAVASRHRLGGDTDLIPERWRRELPSVTGVWNVLRVRVQSLDPKDWPVEDLPHAEGFLFNPIEVIRWCRSEPYRHHIGPGSLHGLEPLRRGYVAAIGSGSGITVAVPTLLRSEPLGGEPALVALAHDPAFNPIEKGHVGKDVITAIQRAFAAGHYDLGLFGAALDGIHGEFDETLERIVEHFQKNKLKEYVDRAGQIAGKAVARVRTDGKIDWITLLGLDMLASSHRDKPAPAPEPSTAAPPPAPVESPHPPAAMSNTFDATTRGKPGLSIHFGIRMYRALLEWLWTGTWDKNKQDQDDYRGDAKGKGVGYSTTNKHHYGSAEQVAAKPKTAVLDVDLVSEWPDIGVPDARAKDRKGRSEREVADQKYPIYYCFGVYWIGTNFTNCCNSQMAALARALLEPTKGQYAKEFAVKGGEAFGVARDERTPVTYPICKDTPTVNVGWYGPVFKEELVPDPKDKTGKKKQKKRVKVMELDGKTQKTDFFTGAQPILTVFEQTFVSGQRYYKNGDKAKPIYGVGEGASLTMDYGGMIYAVKEFGIGEPLFSLNADDQTPENRLETLVGDLATTKGHAWMVGDVRYGVWKEGNVSARPNFVVDQSTFVGDTATGYFVAVPEDINLTDPDWVNAIDARPDALKDLARKNPGNPEFAGGLTKGQCEWLYSASNESLFTARIREFLDKAPVPARRTAPGAPATGGRPGGSLSVGGGVSIQVAKIEVLRWRVFSANGGYNTAHSMEFDGTGDGDCKCAPFKLDKTTTAATYHERGITRPWAKMERRKKLARLPSIAVARLYRPVR